MLKLIRRLKKGVSIVEVVIAIAVISIISVSAVSTLTYAKKAQEKNLRDYDLANTCNAVIDCFWLDSSKLFDNLQKIYIKDNENIVNKDNDDIITINRTGYTLKVKYDSHSLTLTASDNSGDFYTITYQGGA